MLISIPNMNYFFFLSYCLCCPIIQKNTYFVLLGNCNCQLSTCCATPQLYFLSSAHLLSDINSLCEFWSQLSWHTIAQLCCVCAVAHLSCNYFVAFLLDVITTIFLSLQSQYDDHKLLQVCVFDDHCWFWHPAHTFDLSQLATRPAYVVLEQ